MHIQLIDAGLRLYLDRRIHATKHHEARQRDWTACAFQTFLQWSDGKPRRPPFPRDVQPYVPAEENRCLRLSHH